MRELDEGKMRDHGQRRREVKGGEGWERLKVGAEVKGFREK